MYVHHFGLATAPVSRGIANEAAGLSRRGAPRRPSISIEIACSTRTPSSCCSDAPGLGKTTLAAHALRADGTRLAIGWLAAAPQTPTSCSSCCWRSSGSTTYGRSRAERMPDWRQYLRELGPDGNPRGRRRWSARSDTAPGCGRKRPSAVAASATKKFGLSLALAASARLDAPMPTAAQALPRATSKRNMLAPSSRCMALR